MKCPGRFCSPGTSLNLQVLHHSSLAGLTCSSLFPLLQQLLFHYLAAYYELWPTSLCHLQPFLQHKNVLTHPAFQRESRILCKSVIGGVLVVGNQKVTMAAPKKKCTKRSLYIQLVIYLFRKQEKETKKAADRALRVGIKSGKDRNSGNWKHCTVTSSLDFTMVDNVFECTVVCTKWSKMCVLQCNFECVASHWQ